MTWLVRGIAATQHDVYVLRADGAMFVLLRRGVIDQDGNTVPEPRWAHCPAVPGTEAAIEQEG
jgi:hypothetical protein